MKNSKAHIELRDKLAEGFKKARKKLIEEEKKRNGYLVLFRNGKVVKVPANEL